MKLTKNLKLIILFLEFFEKPILGVYIWSTNQLAGDRNLPREIYRDDAAPACESLTKTAVAEMVAR